VTANSPNSWIAGVAHALQSSGPAERSAIFAVEEARAMGFSGIRAVILIAVLVGLVYGVSQLDLPGWIVPVGLIGSAAGLRAWEKRASS
jgi:hypothetical protein